MWPQPSSVPRISFLHFMALPRKRNRWRDSYYGRATDGHSCRRLDSVAVGGYLGGLGIVTSNSTCHTRRSAFRITLSFYSYHKPYLMKINRILVSLRNQYWHNKPCFFHKDFFFFFFGNRSPPTTYTKLRICMYIYICMIQLLTVQTLG